MKLFSTGRALYLAALLNQNKKQPDINAYCVYWCKNRLWNRFMSPVITNTMLGSRLSLNSKLENEHKQKERRTKHSTSEKKKTDFASPCPSSILRRRRPASIRVFCIIPTIITPPVYGSGGCSGPDWRNGDGTGFAGFGRYSFTALIIILRTAFFAICYDGKK